VIGDKRKFPVVLIVPNWDSLEKWARLRNLPPADRAQLLAMPAVREKMEREVMSELDGLARFEVPKKIGLLEHDFSIERGELTPTLKVKRRVVDKTYKELIDSLYAGDVEALRSA
jgi:long-chain acyl-CoA synthetase